MKKIWYKEKIMKIFYEKKEELGRNPNIRELPWGALDAIYKGGYDPNIRTYNGFLRDLDEETNYKNWNKETIQKAYYELKKELGRTPTTEELPSGAIHAIYKGGYDPNIRTYNGFLRDIGEKVNNRNRADITRLLEDIAGEGGDEA